MTVCLLFNVQNNLMHTRYDVSIYNEHMYMIMTTTLRHNRLICLSLHSVQFKILRIYINKHLNYTFNISSGSLGIVYNMYHIMVWWGWLLNSWQHIYITNIPNRSDACCTGTYIHYMNTLYVRVTEMKNNRLLYFP